MADLKSLRDKLLGSIDRWTPEIKNAPARSTLRIGMLHTCYGLVQGMLEICSVEAVGLTGVFGEQALQVCSKGKPPSRMTLGEHVQLLVKLDAKLAKALPQSIRVRRARVLGKSGIQLLHSISSNRNQFTHPKGEDAQPEFDLSRVDGRHVAEWLAHAAEFCNSDLVTMIIATQESRKRTQEFAK